MRAFDLDFTVDTGVIPEHQISQLGANTAVVEAVKNATLAYLEKDGNIKLDKADLQLFTVTAGTPSSSSSAISASSAALSAAAFLEDEEEFALSNGRSFLADSAARRLRRATMTVALSIAFTAIVRSAPAGYVYQAAPDLAGLVAAENLRSANLKSALTVGGKKEGSRYEEFTYEAWIYPTREDANRKEIFGGIARGFYLIRAEGPDVWNAACKTGSVYDRYQPRNVLMRSPMRSISCWCFRICNAPISIVG
ncbi:unnamed protein product [Amoebophrya sp. A120]|nr:unnamed protein product [Amoebophrya sp. A120]|eukprot:GSA120T00021077001.1